MAVDNRTIMPKVSLDMPAEILTDIKRHVGDEKKFVSVADAIRTACRKLLDQLDEIDLRKKNWKNPTNPPKKGVLAKYAASVKSASLGAITD